MPILENNSAGKQLFVLLLILVSSVFIITPLGILIAVPFVDGNIFTALSQMNLAETDQDIALLKYFQIISQLGLFFVSSLLFAVLVSKSPLSYFGMNKSPKISLIGIALVISIVSSPVLNWVMEVNYQAHLPEAFASLENWMRQMEIEATRLTELFLNGNNMSTLLVNLLMMAVLAGLGEELLLRGAIQPLLIKITKNAHIGIWVAAALFSLMHFQFFGFIPRMLLGALFGYYYYWSRNLWIPIIAHILNNGFIVVYVFFSGTSDFSPKLGELNANDSSSGLLIILSASLSIAGLLFFYREGLKQAKQRG
ncbi:MAG: CPBP family intramembrane metalloprotease [Bacteroidales bacterium]|jgi:membrane protease YdiL (CAAX protease family)|nr:CPBP family intramembrane metalloprotease [Bacteroidales bacterium]